MANSRLSTRSASNRLAQSAWVFAALVAASGSAFSQNVTVNPGAGSYVTLADAFTAINAGTHTGALTVSIVGDTTEPAGGAILNASGSGTASYKSVAITPSGARTISGAATAGSPLIDLNGADNVTINGLNASGNSLIISNATASTTSGTSTIRLIGGATGNTITNATIRGAANMAVATNGGTIFISTDVNTANGNDNNTISNNNIGPVGTSLPTKAIACNGSQSTTAIGNSGITVTNNDIFDYFGAAVTSSGVFVANGCNTWQITNNRFYQSTTRTWTTGAMHRAIDINSGSATFGAQGFTISGNTIGYASPTQTGTYTLTGSTGKFTAIFLAAISDGAGIAPNVISNNTVTAISLTGVTSSGTGTTGSPFIGLMALNGPITTENNSIGSQSATSSIVFSTNTTTNLEIHGIYNFSVNNWLARGNTVGGISMTNAGTSNIVFNGIRANTGTGLTWTAENNIVGGAIANSIQSTSAGTASSVVGMVSNNAITTATGNIVRNMTTNSGNSTSTTASMVGMQLTSTGSAGVHTLQRNTISNLSNTNASNAVTVAGMQLNGPTGFTGIVSRNSISNLVAVSSSTSAAVNGINFSGGLFNLSNNFIRLGQDTTGADLSAGVPLSGINELLGTNVWTHNTVLVQGSGVAGTANTFALNSTVTVNNRSYRNNIFVNTRSNGAGTGKHYAARFGGSTPSPAGLSANNNLYFVNGTGGVLGFFNLLDHPNLAAFQAATGVDAGSISSEPALVSATDLRLTAASPARDVGANNVGVTIDFDGKARPGANLLFDMGADEFDGIAPEPNDIAATAFVDPSNPGIRPANVAFTVRASFTNAGTATQTAVPVRYRILDAGSTEVYNQTATIASLAPLAAATATFASVTLPPGNFTIIATAELATDTVPANNTITGALQVVPPLTGTFTVGSGGTYASLTNPGGAFDAINAAGATGQVSLNIISDLSAETGAIVLNQVQGGGSIAIRPAPSVIATVSGSVAGCLIRLNGADNVTIDGSNTAGATTRDLTFNNTSTSTAAGVICLSSLGLGLGAADNTLRNFNVRGNDPTTTLIGVSVGGGTAGSAGANNNNTRIQNLSVRRAIFGIFSSGDATSLNTGTIIEGNDLTGTGADRVRRVGVLVFNDNGTQIIGNQIGGIDSNESADSVGIGLGVQDANNATTSVGGGVINALVARNVISGVASQSTTGFSAVGIGVAGGTGANTVVNNMISGVIGPATSPDSVFGIFVAGSATSSTRVLFNSVLLTGDRGTVATQTPSYGIALVGTTGATVELRNNIVVNNQTSGGGANATSFALGTGATTFTGITASNNLYFTSGANASGFRSGSLNAAAGGTVINHGTLAAWQTASGTDATSLFADPLYVSATDLHIQPSSPASNAGVPVAGVTNDVDGQIRSLIATEIGADELPLGILSLSPATVNFGNQLLGSTSSANTVTLTNNGSGPVSITALDTPAAPFTRTGGSCAAPTFALNAGATCSLIYTFAPTGLGAATQTLNVTSSDKGSGTIALSGNGVQGNLVIAGSPVVFGNQDVGTTSPAQTVTLSNTGTAPLNVTELTAAAAPFARSKTGTCSAVPITLAPSSSCTLTFTFAPTNAGAANQTLTVTANAPGSGTIALSGNGLAGTFSVTPNPVAFGNVLVGTQSTVQTVTLSNTGNGNVQVTALPAPTAPFVQTGGSCTATPFTLAAATSCTVIYRFDPTVSGPASQSLAIASSPGGTTPLQLTGTGIVTADLSIAKSSNLSFANSGLVQYTLIVSNAGPSNVSGARVVDNLPSSLSNVTWSCIGITGGVCNTGSAGNINQLIDLSVGGTVVFSIAANINLPAPVSISNTATVTAPSGVTEINPANNTSTVVDPLIIFANGFESVTAPPNTSALIANPNGVSTLTISSQQVADAVRGMQPGDVVRYLVGGQILAVQVRVLGDQTQARVLIGNSSQAWQIGEWSNVDASRGLLLLWSNTSDAQGHSVLIAQLSGK